MALAPKLPSPLGKATGLQAQAPVLIPQIITISDGYQPYGYFSYGHCCSYLAGPSIESQPFRVSTRDNRPLTGLSPSLHTVAARADGTGTRI